MCAHPSLGKPGVGSYKFGDFSKAIARDFEATVEETVVKSAVKKQRELGKFEKVREEVRLKVGC